MKQEVKRLREFGELRCSDTVAEQLQRISAKTIDRLLAREKQVRGLRRNRNPGVQRLNWERVPVKVAAEWDTQEVGNLQVDFVAHCGRSTGGDYIHTLSAVDIASGWWEGQAIAVRSQQETKLGLEQMRPRFPFALKEIHSDNDSAMINDLLWDWCRAARIRMSRSRPYKKNDNAWVEQKNWTHVRKVVGYRRYDTTTELKLLNEIYALARLYRNFFQPAIKLRDKTRIDGRIKRVYEKARTPYERLLTSGQIPKQAQQRLRTQYQQLNPAELRRQIETLQQQLEQISHAKGDVVHRPAARGPAIWVSKWRRRKRMR
ncbi:MAG TPA: transposase family protein [Acidobacteriaceae bacterium]|nr:transposase family protein [Acidobacteriaceae bacterium]